MSAIIDGAVAALNERLGSDGFDGSAKFVIEDEGSVRIDENGASADDGDADVTMTADADTFQSVLDKSLDPTAAVMSGRMTIDGDMGLAMKLASVLG